MYSKLYDRLPAYTANTIDFKGTKVLIAEPIGDNEFNLSITNSVELLARKHIVNDVIYKDSNGIWDGWNKWYGFIHLDSDIDYCNTDLLNKYIMIKQLKNLK